MKTCFWCETCDALPLKNEMSATAHLMKVHKIEIIRNYTCEAFTVTSCIGFKDYAIVSCNFCGKKWKINANDVWDIIYKNASIFEAHRKSHSKYQIGNLPFKGITTLLRYVDKKFGVHICYEKGLTKKKLFLDGITIEEILGKVKT